MKNLYLFLLIVLSPCTTLFGQQPPGAGLDNWTIDTLFLNPNIWQSSNGEVEPGLWDTTAVTYSFDKVSGTFSVRLETFINGPDTATNYLLLGDWGHWGNLSEAKGNGVAYAGGKSDTLAGWWKYNISVGDTGYLIAKITSGGVPVDTSLPQGMYIWPITGTQSTWTRFAFPVNDSMLTIDSLLMAVTSSNTFDKQNETPFDGSWIMLDDLEFTSSDTAVVPDIIPNAGFEDWHDLIVQDPDGWVTKNYWVSDLGLASVSRGTDVQNGLYAAELTNYTITQWAGDTVMARLQSSDLSWDSFGAHGGWPYADEPGEFSFWYKYLPVGQDTAYANIQFTQGGTIVGSAEQKIYGTQNTYAQITMNTNITSIPDTMAIWFDAGQFPVTRLIIDQLVLSSFVGEKEDIRGLSSISLYPNPGNNMVNIDINAITNTRLTLKVFNALGQIMVNRGISGGSSTVKLNVSELTSGQYLIVIEDVNASDVYTKQLIIH